MSAIATNRSHRPADDLDEAPAAASRGKVQRLTVAPPEPQQYILAVHFRSPEGRTWNAIGGGATVAEAIDWARDGCPRNTTWQPVSWNDLYGD